jgi:hypothetical protein
LTELEHALVRLGAELDFPETPDVASVVRRRLGRPQRRSRLRLPETRTLAVAFAVFLAVAGAVLAVPPARSAILDFLGLHGATIERVETLPDLPPEAGALDLGRPVSLEEAQESAEFDVLVPGLLGEPGYVFYSASAAGGRVSLVYPPGDDLPASRYTGVGLLVTEFRGDLSPDLVGKLVDGGARVEPVMVGGQPGFWIEGGPHVFFYRDARGDIVEDTMRLAGNSLLFERGTTLVRLEGSRELTRGRALAMAASLAPPG